VVPTVIGSAKANSRSINSMSRQMSKHQMVTAGTSTGNRNSGSQTLLGGNSHAKTPTMGITNQT